MIFDQFGRPTGDPLFSAELLTEFQHSVLAEAKRRTVPFEPMPHRVGATIHVRLPKRYAVKAEGA